MRYKNILLLTFMGPIGILYGSFSEKMGHLPIIFAISGSELTQEEIAFFEKYRPIGTILFQGNLELDDQGNVHKEKLKKLCSDIHMYSPYILTDQEGGRVQHLKGSNFYGAPAPGSFVKGLTEENFQGKSEALCANVNAIDDDLLEAGVDINCAPCCDLLFEGVPSCIGDRSFGTNPEIVYSFAVEWVKQAARDGIISVLKHCPGHGSTSMDSHSALPIVNKSLPDLIKSDFKIFKDIAKRLQQDGIDEDHFWIMTAHVIYQSIDPERCATQSSTIIDMIREKFNFKGKIVSDCICMKALSGELWERAVASLNAGCNYIICCTADLDQKKIIAEKIIEYLASAKKSERKF